MRTNTRSLDDVLDRARRAQAEGERVVAESLLREAIQTAPRDPRPRQLLGAVLVERDDTDEGIEVLECAAELAGPLSVENMGVYNNLANALRCGKRFDDAEELLRRLVDVGPREWQHWHNLAQVLKDTERFDEAVAPIRRAITLEPEHGPNHAVLGSILMSVGRVNSAIAAFRRCIDLGWDQDVNVWTQLGSAYRLLGDVPDTMAALERAHELSQGGASTFSNLGIVLNQLGRFAEAHANFETAIRLEPEVAMWKSNLGYSQLTAGQLPGAWDNWEHGLESGPRGNERPSGAPRWQPENGEQRVLCYREQGVGDEILFASCLPDLATAARDVVYEADSRVVSLFARSFPGIEVRKQTWSPLVGQTIRDFDAAIPVGSLPLHFRATVDRFPSDRPSYLVADPERVSKWRARVAEIAGSNAVVGMSWRSRIRTAERRLEYTHLEEWGGLFSVPGVTWLNLQYDDCERELFAAEQEFGVTIHRWKDVDYMNDFEEVAAIMRVCDLVVAPRNAVAMLSGALGVPTAMMGNRWDWSDLGTDTCPWLPSVELIYRHVGEDWDQVLATAANRVSIVAARKETA